MQLKVKSAAGRPTRLTDELRGKILTGIAAGASVRSLMRKLRFNESTLFGWRTRDKEFATQYQEALALRTELQAEELLDMVAECNEANASAIRVKAAIMQWVMSKMMPKKFGDRMPEDRSVDQVMVPIVQVNFGRTDGPAAKYPDAEDPEVVEGSAETIDLKAVKMMGEE